MSATTALRAACAAVLALLCTLIPGASALASGFIITVEPGGNDVPLALPKPTTPSGDEWGDADELWAIVHRDLEMSGYFNLIDPSAYIDKGGIAPGTFEMADWRAINAVALAKMSLQPREHDIQVDLYVYDVSAGTKITGRAFVGKPADLRYVAHRAADAIITALTGQPSLFGSRIAAVGSQSGNKEVYILDIDGEGVRAVTRNGSINLSPAWSPTGTELAWTSYKRGNPDVYVKDLVTGHTRVLSNRPGINSGAAFSPDGSTVALGRSAEAETDVFLIDAKTGEERARVTRGGGIDVAPDYDKTGKYLAYSSERSGGSQIYVQDLATGEAKRATFAGEWNTDPVISPDGTKIAYVTRAGTFDIMVVDIDGRNPVRITQDMGDNEDPCWSPDGRYLVFSSTRRGRSEIWISTADGRHQVPITTGSTGWQQPTWQPNGN
jgi:TolB protein